MKDVIRMYMIDIINTYTYREQDSEQDMKHRGKREAPSGTQGIDIVNSHYCRKPRKTMTTKLDSCRGNSQRQVFHSSQVVEAKDRDWWW